MAGTMNTWNPYREHVQGNLQDGKFLNATTALVAAGPPRLSYMGVTPTQAVSGTSVQQLAQPIGLVQNIAISHNRAFSRIFEIGSERSYFIPGRTVGQATMGRVLYNGWSLLRVLYSHYLDTSGSVTVPQIFPFAGTSPGYNHHDVKIPAGYNNFFINLASDLFTQPLGLLFIIKDSNEDGYGAFYLEQCYIPNHTLATDSQGTLFQESVAVQFEHAWPVKVTGMDLFSQMLEGLGGLANAL